MLKMLKGLFKSERHWLLEFLQNAEDANAQRFSVQFEDEALTIMNDGHTITNDEFKSLCGVRSHKGRSHGHLGYLGLGFKSIFRVTDRVDVHSATFHFKFDRSHWVSHEPLAEWPWEILPLEIEPMPLPEGYNTVFRIPTTDSRFASLSVALTNFMVGPDFPSEIVLLLENVRALEVRVSGRSFALHKETIFEEVIERGFAADQQKLPKVQGIALIKREYGNAVPEVTKYLLVSKKVPVPPLVASDRTTEEEACRSGVQECDIGLVFGLDAQGAMTVLQGRLAGVYSFLPLEGEQTGLPFGVFGDFVPDPGRDIIKYALVWNRWLCEEITTLFGQAMDYFVHSTPIRRLFPAVLLSSGLGTSTTAGGPGLYFWVEHVLSPIKTILQQGCFYPDIHGELRTMKELVFLDSDLFNALGRDAAQLLEGCLLPLYLADQTLEKVPDIRTMNSYDILQDERLLEAFRMHPDILRKLYSTMAKFSDYYLQGRPDKKSKPRDKPLVHARIILGSDNLYHFPTDILVPATLLAQSSGLVQSHDFLQRLAEHRQEADTVLLHPTIASDGQAVEQLRRCGVEVQTGETLLSRVSQQVKDTRSETDCCKAGWSYPDDLIKATLYLITQQRPPVGIHLVSSEGHLKEPRHLFLAGSRLDWERVRQSGFLPGYDALHSLYCDPTLLARYDLSKEALSKFLEDIGVHGFSAKGDRDLIQDAAYAVAEEHLREDGHDPQRVQHRQDLGYDLECRGHCRSVFEVKGMSEPEDVGLEPSETRAANERLADYYLVCVYNLPERTDCIVQKNNLNQVWQPVERARVPKAKWLRSA
jgi:hypothetical protein